MCWDVFKVGADEFPDLKILATGSSTLAASKKFRDTLTGRKRAVHLTPVTWNELPAFGVPVQRRLFHGGLPLRCRVGPHEVRVCMPSELPGPA